MLQSCAISSRVWDAGGSFFTHSFFQKSILQASSHGEQAGSRPASPFFSRNLPHRILTPRAIPEGAVPLVVGSATRASSTYLIESARA